MLGKDTSITSAPKFFKSFTATLNLSKTSDSPQLGSIRCLINPILSLLMSVLSNEAYLGTGSLDE